MAKKHSRFEKIRARGLALWEGRITGADGELTRFHKFVHLWVLVFKSFNRNRCPLRASALSYSTLLALIPMLAVVISVTSSLLKKQGEDSIYHFVDKFVSNVIPPASIDSSTSPDPTRSTTNAAVYRDRETNALAPFSTNSPALLARASSLADTNSLATVASSPGTVPPGSGEDMRVTSAQKEAARRIHEFIQNTRTSALGGVGMLLLISVAIRMLAQIEGTFNDIWGVTQGRSWPMRIMIYWATITLGPMLLVGALSLTGGAHLQATQKLIGRMPLIGHLVFPALTLIVLWLTFTLLYQLVPNTKVRFSAALVGGLVGGLLWHVNNLFGFLYVSRVVTNSKFYGSLGLVPVFMAGIYLSWFILLFGAQVAYAFQNRTLYLQDKLAENVNQRGREFVALRLMTAVGQRFQRGLPPATIQEMSGELGIPSRLVQQVLQTLIAAQLVIEISGAEPAYTPARPLETITAHHVLMAIRATPGQELITRDEPVREEVYGEFARIQEAERQVASGVTMLALVNRAQARLEIAPPLPGEQTIKLTPLFAPALTPVEPAVQSEPIDVVVAQNESEHNPAAKPPRARPAAGPAPDDERDFPL